MYKIDVSVPGYLVTTYPLGIHMLLCKEDRDSTFIISAYVYSMFSMSDYTKTGGDNTLTLSQPTG